MPIKQRKRSTVIKYSEDIRNMRRKLSKYSRRRPRRLEAIYLSSAIALILFSAFRVVTEFPFVPSYGRLLYQVIEEKNSIPLHEGSIVPAHFLPQKPRTLGFYFDQDNFIGAETLDPNMIRYYDFSGKHFDEKMTALLDSRKYRHSQAEQFETDSCSAQYKWQKSFYPTCNYLMEQDIAQLGASSDQESYSRYLAHGYWRDVWKVVNKEQEAVLKTIRYEHDYTERNYDRHRRDAVAMERLTASIHILDIYAFCGHSSIAELGGGGSLQDAISYGLKTDPWSSKEKLIVAQQVASAANAVHHFTENGIPAIAHTDITPSQWVYIESDQRYKLNDFNRCRFLLWDEGKNETCTFEVGSNPGIYRSPEEYNYEPETEKVDVYSMGNVLYAVLTGLYPFKKLVENEGERHAKRKIKVGGRPPIDKIYTDSDDPYTKALLKSIEMCWIQDPVQRASASQVLKYINNELDSLVEK